MPSTSRQPDLALILAFLAIIFAVPLTQIGIELSRGERVQCTDVFRDRPTVKNLRQFERTLEDKSWFQQVVRPHVQRACFRALGDTGAKAVRGRASWLFYRPDVRYLVEPDRMEQDETGAKWVKPPDGSTKREQVVRAIVTFRDQLKERGLELLVVPVPGKPRVYPDRLTRRAGGREQDFVSPTEQLLGELQRQGVESVNLFAAFRQSRRQLEQARIDSALYLAHDTHWTPRGAKLAAEAAARRLNQLRWAPAATNQFRTEKVLVGRRGDLVEMMQIAGLEREFGLETVECERVSDARLGPMVPAPSERPGVYKYPGQKSGVLVLGDSFCRIYQMAEPQSLGQLPGAATAETAAAASTRRLLPGSAGFISLLALALKAPVDAIVSDGGASSDVRQKLSTNPEILEGKKVIVWEFVERDIALGKAGWEDLPLPPKLEP